MDNGIICTIFKRPSLYHARNFEPRNFLDEDTNGETADHVELDTSF